MLLAAAIAALAAASAQQPGAQPAVPGRVRTDLHYAEASSGLGYPGLDGGPMEVEMADVDQDGWVDLVSIGDHGSPFINTPQHGVMVWFGSPGGQWSVVQSGDFGYGGVAVGDVNGDGHPDVGYGMHHDYSATDFGDQLMEVALGDGTGANWTPWDDGLATHGQSWGMSGTDFADVDGDGDLDLGSVSFGAGDGMHVYLNQGNGSWARSWGILSGNSHGDFRFGDVDADGDPDLVSGHASATVYLNDGNGVFTAADHGLPPLGFSGRRGSDLGDVTGDGRLELSFVNDAGGVEVWQYLPSGAWVPIGTGLPATGDFQITQLADMNVDGRTDLVAAGGGFLVVSLGRGDGSFFPVATVSTPSPGNYETLRASFDADRNGHPDLVFVTDEGGFFSSRNHLHFFRETRPAAALRAHLLAPRPGAALRAGSVTFVDWVTEVPGGAASLVDLELSVNGPGGPWMPLATGLPNNGRYQWRLPLVAPTDAHLRITVRTATGTARAVGRGPVRIL